MGTDFQAPHNKQECLLQSGEETPYHQPGNFLKFSSHLLQAVVIVLPILLDLKLDQTSGTQYEEELLYSSTQFHGPKHPFLYTFHLKKVTHLKE